MIQPAWSETCPGVAWWSGSACGGKKPVGLLMKKFIFLHYFFDSGQEIPLEIVTGGNRQYIGLLQIATQKI